MRSASCSLSTAGLVIWATVSCASSVRPVMTAAQHNERAADTSTSGGSGSAAQLGPARAPMDPARPEGSQDSEESSPRQSLEVARRVVPLPRALPQLETFYAKLDALREGQRQQPVRILWLGDSHTAADFLTQELRSHLAGVAGRGGPGFVRLGLGSYRHGAVTFDVVGKIRKAPILPAQRTRVLDGVFGYGGIRTLPAAGSSVTASLREQSSEPVSWTLSYRLPSGASLDVKVGETTTRLSAESESAKLSSAEPGSAGWISSRRFTARAEDRFAVFHVAGDPQIFGAFVEYEKPGVVLDTVGINGARVETTLAWEPDQFVAQVRERSPDLVVIAFGTNEIFDRTNPARYQGQTEELMTRIRKAVPDVACWIVGPPDAARPEGGSRERVVEVTEAQRRAAEASACAFSSQFELMGGEGSFSRWMKERPAKARSDRIHFTISGYEQLGRSLSQQLVPTPDDEVPVAAEQ